MPGLYHVGLWSAFSSSIFHRVYQTVIRSWSRNRMHLMWMRVLLNSANYWSVRLKLDIPLLHSRTHSRLSNNNEWFSCVSIVLCVYLYESIIGLPTNRRCQLIKRHKTNREKICGRMQSAEGSQNYYILVIDYNSFSPFRIMKASMYTTAIIHRNHENRIKTRHFYQ